MYFARRLLLPLLFIGMLLTSCGGQVAEGEPTADINATIQSGAETMVVSLLQTQTALAPTATNTFIPTATATTGPTTTPLTLPSPIASVTQGVIFFSSPTPTGTFYTATPNPSTLANGCNNLALIRDVTVPSGTVMKPGESFTKTWQVANTGTCDWLYVYYFVFVSGNDMKPENVRLGDKVPPKEWRQVSINLEAPKQPGSYTGYWRLADGSGKPFGATLGVSIVVANPTKTPVPPTTYP